jgi:predicted DNA-binding transcriptional regulator AlpA
MAGPATADEIRDLPALVDLPTAARLMGFSRAWAFRTASLGEFPIEVLRVGPRALRVRRADLAQFLGVEEAALQ